MALPTYLGTIEKTLKQNKNFDKIIIWKKKNQQFKVLLELSFYSNHSAEGKHEQIITMNLLFMGWVSLGQPHVSLFIRYRLELVENQRLSNYFKLVFKGWVSLGRPTRPRMY